MISKYEIAAILTLMDEKLPRVSGKIREYIATIHSQAEAMQVRLDNQAAEIERLQQEPPKPLDWTGSKAQIERDLEDAQTLIRDIGQYCEDNRHNSTMLMSLPPQNPVAVHVMNTVLRYLGGVIDSMKRKEAEANKP